MKGQSFEIWRNESSQTWKVFSGVSEPMRQTLKDTGWSEVVQYQGEELTDMATCPEELLRQVSQTHHDASASGDSRRKRKPAR